MRRMTLLWKGEVAVRTENSYQKHELHIQRFGGAARAQPVAQR
jgi:hypothetical protein